MKKIIILSLCVFCSCAPGVFTTQRLPERKAHVIVAESDFNEGNSDMAKTIKKLHLGDSLYIIGQKNTWWFAASGTDTGYIFKEDVMPVKDTTQIMPTVAKADTATLQTLAPFQMKSSYFLGVGGGNGVAFDIGVVYKYIGVGITWIPKQVLSAPATTDPYPPQFLSSSTSSDEKYDMGFDSYELIGVVPVVDALYLQGSIGYFTHSWSVFTTTTDDDGILSKAITESSTGEYDSGISWGAGLQFNVSQSIMLGVNYSSMKAILINIGGRF